jgi:type II secretory pathway predicted ATPase ExeA
MEDTPQARLERWAERDRVVGLVAEAEQLRARVAQRDRELTNLRERCQQLGLRVAELEVERNRLAALVAHPTTPSVARRVHGRLRRVAARALSR